MSTKNSILSLADAKALVHVEGRDAYATSRELADHLGKRHANVLRKIDRLTEETFSQLKMESAEYLDPKGESRKEYRLNRDAVAFCARLKTFLTRLLATSKLGRLNISTHNVIKNVRKFKSDFEEFGQLAFETRVASSHGAGQPTEVAILNEDQLGSEIRVVLT